MGDELHAKILLAAVLAGALAITLVRRKSPGLPESLALSSSSPTVFPQSSVKHSRVSIVVDASSIRMCPFVRHVLIYCGLEAADNPDRSEPRIAAT